ncbi:MAG TPA: flippase [Candidatus Paceibacterota bacterium]|nr:flippase [Candidatus Paceibacterota bacterium]HMP19085.1 flippase [Candidatus Paceibacterota bacterium]
MSFDINYIKEKWRHAGFQKYLRNTGWMFFGRMFSLAVSFFVGAYIARYLGPANYGLMNYAISFVGLFGFLASFGIDGIVNREIVKDHNKKDDLIGTGFFIKLFGAFLTILLIAIVSFLTISDNFTLILILLFSLTFIPQAFNVIEIYFQSQVLAKNIVRSQIIATIVAVCLKILVIILNKGIFWLIFIFFVEACVLATLFILAFLKNGHHFKNWKFKKEIAISILKDSWPLMFSAMAIGIYMKIDQVMIKHMLGDEQVGLYAVAVKLTEVWYFVPGIICASLFPAIVNSKKISNEFFEARMKKLYRLMFGIAISIAIPMTIFAEQIISVLFGESYGGAVPVLRIYVWVLILLFYIHTNIYYLISINKGSILIRTTFIGGISNVIFNTIFIPKIWLSGAAVSIILSLIIMSLFIKNHK